MGHLLGWLSENSDLELVGIDYNKNFCEKGSHLYGKVTFHTIDIMDKEAFRNLLCVEGKRSVVVSLHGCGNVQPILIREFVECDAKYVPLLLTIGCCYHKMTETENNSWLMSNTFREELKVNVNRNGLRLASEYRPKNHLDNRGEKFERRTFSFISRNITEIFYEQLGIKSVTEHRSRRRKLGNTLDEIKNELVNRYNIEGDEKERWFQIFDKIVEDHTKYLSHVKVLLDLQHFLQENYEFLVLLDRLKYLHENNIKAELCPVFDVNISPRNMCIIASR